MKKYGVVTSIMLFSTFLGLISPIQVVTQTKQGKFASAPLSAKADSTNTKAQDIEDATAKFNETLAQVNLDATVNLDGTDTNAISALKSSFDDNLSAASMTSQNDYSRDSSIKGLTKIQASSKYYSDGTYDQNQFNQANTSAINTLTDVSLPVDWESAAELVATFANKRKEEIAVAGATSSATANSVITAQEKYTNPQVLVSYTGKSIADQNISSFLQSKVLVPYLTTNIDGTKFSGKEANTTQIADAKFFVENIANARKQVVNSLASASDKAKADTNAKIDTALASDEEKIDSGTLTFSALGKLVVAAYKQFQDLGPVSDINVVTDQNKADALATLKSNYDAAMSKLSAITGFDVDVKAAKERLETAYAQYQTVINGTETQSALSKAILDSGNALGSAIILKATDTEKTAGINAINAAVTAQTAVINADTKASDAEKATAITTIKNTANQYIPMINANGGITVQKLKTAQDAAISTIKAVTAMHNQLATTAQRNAAMNAVIIAGNTMKVDIQNDTSIAAADKTTAYAAVDKLVTSYTDQMKADKLLTTDLAKLQSAGVAAVTAFQATKTATASTATPTTANTTVAGTTKASAKKVLYAISGLKLYKSDSLKGKTVATYAKHKRTNRPTFLVTKTVKNDAGKKVYYVQNQASGKKGYITSSTKSVAYAYYQTTPKKIQIISKAGVNQYKKANLSTKQKHYKKGQTLKVKKLIKSGVTTRFQLTNGSYISANKKFVIDTQY
ncbi:DUF5776 domain-containing protein [Secundilactobacillus muriivasis]